MRAYDVTEKAYWNETFKAQLNNYLSVMQIDWRWTGLRLDTNQINFY